MDSDAIFYGFNGFSQIPPNYEPFSSYFTNVPTNAGVKYIAFSWSICYILLDDDSIYASGYVDGIFGNLKRMNLPIREEHIVKITVSKGRKRYDLTESGTVWAHEFDIYQELSPVLQNNDKVVDICANDTMEIFLTATGLVFLSGELLPFPIDCKIVKMACGAEHAIFLSNEGDVYLYGNGSRGQLGGRFSDPVNESVYALNFPSKIEDVSAGGWHCAVITHKGQVFTWGWNSHGQLGQCQKHYHHDENLINVSDGPIGPIHFQHVKGKVKQICCGMKHTVALFGL